MTKEWLYKQPNPTDEARRARLSAECAISPLVAQLLLDRGVTTPEAVSSFFAPKLNDLYDPFLMKDMEVAVARLSSAMDNDERVLVYGDYDVDGTAAVSLIYSFLGELGVEVGLYIPDRYREGYGISELGVRFAAENDYTLVIALDCGIKAYHEVALARSFGVDFIICDHHFADEGIPQAVAVLDPKRPDCAYPCKYLSGTGVGFKLLQALSLRRGYPIHNLLRHLDLVALSIAADLVEVLDENRILATHGLRCLNETPSPGIKALKQVAGLGERTIEMQDIIFRLGPRINAAGRMMNGSIAVELFTSPDDATAALYAQIINVSNIKRQGVDRQMTSEALAMASSDLGLRDQKSLILYNPHWHKGLLGIVASRLVDIHYRPVVILTETNGIVSGSARSVPGFDIYEVVSDCADLLDSFGGHTQAVGLTLKQENIEPFKQRFEEVVARRISVRQKRPIIEIDALLRWEDLTPSFFRDIAMFEPFGPRNPAPVFALRGVLPDPSAKLFGRGNEHIKFTVSLGAKFPSFMALAYQQARSLKLVQGHRLAIVFTLENNHFFTPPTIQFNVKDIVSDDECHPEQK